MDAWAPAAVLPLALALDRAFGELPDRWHPVAWLGRALGHAGRWALAGASAGAQFARGAFAWWAGAAAVAAAAYGLEQAVWRALPPWGAALALALLAKPTFAWRMLHDEVAAVEAALARSLAQARAQVARICSRDTSALDESGVRETALESLAENFNDSLVAPLLWFAVGGLAGAALYRYANTADAMWGYRGRWEWAGKWAARADDALSWLPARASALLLAPPRLWPKLAREAARTPSPNGGWPMGALALALAVRLAKPGVYALNPAAAAPQPQHVEAALRRARWAALAWVAVASLLYAAVRV